MKYSYFPTGVCSRQINLELDDNGKITSCEFVGGCSGNTQGICMLVKGMDAKDAVDRLKGIDCRGRGTHPAPISFQRLLKRLLRISDRLLHIISLLF